MCYVGLEESKKNFCFFDVNFEKLFLKDRLFINFFAAFSFLLFKDVQLTHPLYKTYYLFI